MTSPDGNVPAARRVRARRRDGFPSALWLELGGMGLVSPAGWDDETPCAVYLIVNISRWEKGEQPWFYIGSHVLSARGCGETWSNLKYRGSGKGIRSWKTDEVVVFPLEAAPVDGQARWDVESAWLEAYDAAGDPRFANATNIAGGLTTELMAEIHAEKDKYGRSLHSVKRGHATAAKRCLPPEIYSRRGELYGKVELLRDDFLDKKNRRDRVDLARAHHVCCLSGLPLMKPLNCYDIKRGVKTLHRSYDIVLTDRGVALASVYNHLVATPPDIGADGSVPKARGRAVFWSEEEKERNRAARRAAHKSPYH